jgi:hypothetical protein
MNADEARQATKKVKDDQLKETVKQAEIQIQEMDREISRAANAGRASVDYEPRDAHKTSAEIADVLVDMLRQRGFDAKHRYSMGYVITINWR